MPVPRRERRAQGWAEPPPGLPRRAWEPDPPGQRSEAQPPVYCARPRRPPNQAGARRVAPRELKRPAQPSLAPNQARAGRVAPRVLEPEQANQARAGRVAPRELERLEQASRAQTLTLMPGRDERPLAQHRVQAWSAARRPARGGGRESARGRFRGRRPRPVSGTAPGRSRCAPRPSHAPRRWRAHDARRYRRFARAAQGSRHRRARRRQRRAPTGRPGAKPSAGRREWPCLPGLRPRLCMALRPRPRLALLPPRMARWQSTRGGRWASPGSSQHPEQRSRVLVRDGRGQCLRPLGEPEARSPDALARRAGCLEGRWPDGPSRRAGSGRSGVPSPADGPDACAERSVSDAQDGPSVIRPSAAGPGYRPRLAQEEGRCQRRAVPQAARADWCPALRDPAPGLEPASRSAGPHGRYLRGGRTHGC